MKLLPVALLGAALTWHTSACGQTPAVGLAQNSASPANVEPAARPVDNTPKVQVRGVVRCPEGPLPGAVVHLNGTRTYVVTDAQGNFELNLPTSAAAAAEVTCSFAGFRDTVQRLKAKSVTTITLDKPTELPPRDRSAETGWW